MRPRTSRLNQSSSTHRPDAHLTSLPPATLEAGGDSGLRWTCGVASSQALYKLTRAPVPRTSQRSPWPPLSSLVQAYSPTRKWNRRSEPWSTRISPISLAAACRMDLACRRSVTAGSPPSTAHVSSTGEQSGRRSGEILPMIMVARRQFAPPSGPEIPAVRSAGSRPGMGRLTMHHAHCPAVRGDVCHGSWRRCRRGHQKEADKGDTEDPRDDGSTKPEDADPQLTGVNRARSDPEKPRKAARAGFLAETHVAGITCCRGFGRAPQPRRLGDLGTGWWATSRRAHLWTTVPVPRIS